MTIDVKEWRDFRVGDLFECDTTLSIPSKNDLVDGDINYVTRSAIDNGLSGTCGNEDHRNEGKCITIGAEGFVAFYQTDDFVAGNKVYTIRHEQMNELSGLFVCTALNTLSDRYSFSDARVLDRIKAEIIKLPVTPDGELDWAYMEQYMRDVMTRQADVIDHLARISKEKHPVPMRSWGGFRVGALFEIKYSKVYHTRQLEEVAVGLPYVTRGQYNNGLKCHVKDSDKLVHNPGGVISFGAEGSAFFYQKNEYVSGRDMYYLDTRHLSEAACLFVVSCLSVIAEKYSYTNGMFPKKVADDFIKLPVTESGEPDWAYMEDYMRQVMDRQAYVVDCLKNISMRKAG